MLHATSYKIVWSSMAFYRKYRPQKFSDLMGQEHIVKTLTNALKLEKFGHAYLFSGPRGVGKTTMARLLAKALNCQGKSGFEPCDNCDSCKDVIHDKSLDVIEVDAASNRGIDEIRELREKIKFAPTKSKYKIYIIDEVHMLTKEAFNALLKTLEEPPAHAIFIMATTELHKIPATILSRVQQFDFKRASIDKLIEYLSKIAKEENLAIDPEALRLITFHGEGSYRDATSILDQVASLGLPKITLQNVQEILGVSDEKSVIDFLLALASDDSDLALNIISSLYFEGTDLLEFSHRLIEYLRKILLYTNNLKMFETAELTVEQKENVKDLAKKLENKNILDLMKKFIEASREIKGSNLPQLPLEMAVLDIVDEGKRKKEKVKSDEDDKPEKVEKIEIKKVEPEKPKQDLEPSSEKNIDPINIKEHWENILRDIEPNNRSLYLILKESDPKGLIDGKFVLGVNYKIYAERIENKKNYAAIGSSMEKIMGRKFPVECVLIDKKSEISVEEGLIGDALEVFG